MRVEGAARNHGRKVESAVYYIDSGVHTRTSLPPPGRFPDFFPLRAAFLRATFIEEKKNPTSNDTSYLAFKTYVSGAAPEPAGY